MAVLTAPNRLCEVGVYARLSKGDAQNSRAAYRTAAESVSIENQVVMLKEYAQSQGWLVKGVYTDDGYSGGSFERPGFQEMMRDVEQGRVNLILVRELSRFGRDSMQVEQYTTDILPAMGCRFVSLSEGIDTERPDNELIPFMALINDFYLKDISRKIKSVLRKKAENGQCLMTYTPYGYRQSEDDKYQLAVDEYAAGVVRRMFGMRLRRMGYAAIARVLNEEGIPPPRTYWNRRRGKTDPEGAHSVWRDATVKKILKSDVYLGHLTQMKTGTLTYKNKKLVQKDEGDWVRLVHAHEAIIDQETWDAVQVIGLENVRPQAPPTPSLFAGLLTCPDCGGKLSCRTESQRRKNGTVVKYRSYGCPTYYQTGRSVCSSHRIYELSLIEMVKADLQRQFQWIECDEASVCGELERRLCKGLPELEQVEASLREDAKRLKVVEGMACALYEEKLSGRVSQAELTASMKRYEDERLRITKRKERLEKQKTAVEKKFLDSKRWKKLIRRCVNVQTLDRALLEELIERIEIGERRVVDGKKQQKVKIIYKFVGCLDE